MEIEKRSIGKCILLSLVTFGIYLIIWDIKLVKEAVKVKDKNDDGTLELILTLFIPFVGTYLLEKKFADGCKNYGYQKEDRSIIYLILGLFGLALVDIALIQDDLNKFADYCVANNIFEPVAAPMAQNTAASQFAQKNNDIACIEELRKYKALLDDGIITEEEFKAKKEQLLK